MKDTTSHHQTQGASTGIVTLIPTKHPELHAVRIAGPFGLRFVAQLDGNVLKKLVKAEHIFHAVNGVGVSAAVILSPALKFDWITVDLDGRRLCTSRSFIQVHAIPFHIRGYEPQLGLPLNLWGEWRAAAWKKEEDRKARPAKEEMAQRSLFGDAA